MSIKVAIINGKQPSAGVGGVSDADLSAAIVDFINPGYVGTDAFKVTPPGGTAKEVIIKAGRYYAPNPSGSMIYVVDLDTDYTLAIPSNASGNPRKDAIVLKIDLGTTPNNFANNIGSFIDVQGTPAVTPTVPNAAAIQSAVLAGNVGVKLGEVTAAAGFTTITSGNIADSRTVAQLSKDGLEPIGSGQLESNAIATDKINNSAVTSEKINNGAVTSAKMAPSLTTDGSWKVYDFGSWKEYVYRGSVSAITNWNYGVTGPTGVTLSDTNFNIETSWVWTTSVAGNDLTIFSTRIVSTSSLDVRKIHPSNAAAGVGAFYIKITPRS